ncbi:MAG: leucine-rich repeat protein [Clostridia bacterium]|nr:leucine-rich repeat protein [Clostridia bacterium]
MKKLAVALFLLGLLVFAIIFPASAKTNQLSYTLLKDGSGYEISECAADATVVMIPAEYEGLPVKSVADRAFTSCPSLKMFVVNPDNQFLYSEDGVLFTDNPVKTLLRFPNQKKYDSFAYQVPEGTEVIAPWAFSGCSFLQFLHIPEGVTTLGDYAFAEATPPINLSVYVPDSLTKIGKNLTQNIHGNLAVYGNKGSAMLKYAKGHRIPCQEYKTMEPLEKTVIEGRFDLTDADVSELPDPEKRVLVQIVESIDFYGINIVFNRDISGLQNMPHSEVYFPLEKRWPAILPNSEGKTANGHPALEGLYGIGYTETEAVLRGYDAKGNITGTRKVNGDFMFSLPGAVSMGIAGGSNTNVAVVPYEPVIISSPGDYPLSRELFRSSDTCAPIRSFIQTYPYSYHSAVFPDYLNIVRFRRTEAFGATDSATTHWAMMTLVLEDPYLLDQINQITYQFHAMETIYENDDITFMASQTYMNKLEKSIGEKAWNVFATEMKMMEGVYYPAGAELNHVVLLLNGVYPSTFSVDSSTSYINLDDQCLPFSKNGYAYTHEMVHAIDESFRNEISLLVPSAWMEGRAEYIGNKACKALKLRGNGDYPKRYKWSFLSEEDKADFFSYYYNSTNRETSYPVGYYFFKYLCDTYGEDISVRITENIMNASFTESNKAEVFKECVTSVTDPDVFQNFVRDVIK